MFVHEVAKALVVTVLSQLRGRLSPSWVHHFGLLASPTKPIHILGTCCWVFASSRTRYSRALVSLNRLRDRRDLIKQCDNSRLRFFLLPHPFGLNFLPRDHIRQSGPIYIPIYNTIRCILRKGSKDVKNFSGMLVNWWLSLRSHGPDREIYTRSHRRLFFDGLAKQITDLCVGRCL